MSELKKSYLKALKTVKKRNSWISQLFVIAIFLCLQLSLNITYANTPKEYFTFLAYENNNGEIKVIQIRQRNNLLNIPIGNYYLRTVIVSDNNYKYAAIRYTNKISIKKDKKGVKIVNVKPLMNTLATRNTLNTKFEPVSLFEKSKPLGEPLLSFLRKLIVKKTSNNLKLFWDSKFEIHRTHTFKGSDLDNKKLQALWRIWDPEINGYSTKNSIINNLKNLESKIDNADNQAFDNSTDPRYQEDNKVFLKAYINFIKNLKNEYRRTIEKDKKDFEAQEKLYEGEINIINSSKTICRDISEYYMSDEAKNQNLTSLCSELTSVRALTNEVALKAYQQEDYKNGLRELRRIMSKNNSLVDLSNNIKEQLPEQLFGKINILKLIAGITFIATLAFLVAILFGKSKQYKKIIALVKKNRNDENESFIEPPSIPNSRKVKVNNERDKLDPKVDFILNKQHKKEILDALEKRAIKIQQLTVENELLTKENKRLNKVIKEEELLEMANDSRFIREFFNNVDVRRNLERLLRIDSLKEGNKERTSFFKTNKSLPPSNLFDKKARHEKKLHRESTPDLVKEEQAQSSTQQPNETSISLLKTRLDEHRIIRSEEMKKEFDQVIQNDLLLAKSLSGWLKPNMAPSAYEQINTILENYENGKISLFIPTINSLFKPEEHDLTANREKEMRGKGAKVIKIVRPGVKMKEANGSTSIVSRAQVEIKT